MANASDFAACAAFTPAAAPSRCERRRWVSAGDTKSSLCSLPALSNSICATFCCCCCAAICASARATASCA